MHRIGWAEPRPAFFSRAALAVLVTMPLIIQSPLVPDGQVAAAQFTAPSELRNPSKQPFNTAGLEFQAFLNYVFYGRFDRLRADDPHRARFAWMYFEFVTRYGARFARHLTPPLKELVLTKHITRGDVTTSSSATYVMESRIVESFQRNEDIRGGVFSTMDRDIDAILDRHAPDSPAMKQFYENLYRYASNRPPVQDDMR